MRNIPIGQYLVEQNMITNEQLEKVLFAQKESQGQKRFGEVIVEMGYMTEIKFAQALAGKLKVPYVELQSFKIDDDAVSRIPESLAKK